MLSQMFYLLSDSLDILLLFFPFLIFQAKCPIL
jgi:hypothetical protein